MASQKIIRSLIFIGLWSILIIPFYVANSMFFPFITGKNFLFRIIVEIIFALWVYLAYIDAKFRPKFSWVLGTVIIFVAIMAIADAFAVAPIKSFFSNFERMDGWITQIHLLLYLVVFGSMMKTEKMWLWFLRTSVVGSGIMAILAIAEYVKTGVERVNTTLGNTIYVGVYFLFNLFLALILINKDVIQKKATETVSDLKNLFSNVLTYVYGIFAILSLIVIWWTSRGVLLGLLGGLIIASLLIIFFEKKNKLIRNISISVVVLIAVLVGGFFAIKNTPLVHISPTLERFASISWSSIAGQGQARQYVWPMALKGFKEKPILGWGQDGFNYVFNKYYDPRMWNQEQWFDRAHDMPLDVLVAGGILGLLAYLSIFVASVWITWKKRNVFGVIGSSLIIGLLASYFAQNLFVFDNLTSYVYFFIVLAYIHSVITEHNHVVEKNGKKINPDIANYVIAPIMIVIACGSIWYLNIRPIEANLNLISGMCITRDQNQTAVSCYPEGFSKNLDYFKKAISLNTLGNPEIREQLMSISPSLLTLNIDPKIKQDFVDFTYGQIQEQLAKTPKDARYQLFAGTFFDNIGQYQMALPYLLTANDLSQNKQTMLFELAKCYAYLGQKDKALATAKKAYELETDDTDAKNYYVAMLILNDRVAEGKTLLGTATTSSDVIVRSYLLKAQEFWNKGDKNSAIGEIQQAIAIAPAFKQQGESIIQAILKGTIKS